ncbi:MAG: hypothetical protein IPI41_12180 [Flavobacteriales bacterium]|nr:hypothetical protein [Flavobacteriales bacterium]
MLGAVATATATAQAKKPTLMVVPSDNWCYQNGFILEYDNQGKMVKTPDYKRALQENSDLLLVISKINQLMTDRGFPLKNLESSLKTLESEAAEDNMSQSKSGGEVSESPTDKLKKVAKADIWMQLTWTVNEMGPKRSITFNLQGLDAYTDKQVAGASGTGPQSQTPELAILLEEAVLSQLDLFNGQLQKHFDDLFANGREVTLRIKKWDSFSGDLESEYGGEELSTQIENWVTANTVQGRNSLSDATENMMLFEQVRIPLYDATGKAVDTRGWARGLQKHLKDAYQIEAKLVMKGLGQATIIVGEK